MSTDTPATNNLVDIQKPVTGRFPTESVIFDVPYSLQHSKAIVYSLFGYNEQHENCFSFHNYLQGLMINLRLARLLYVDWDIVLQTDSKTYVAFKDFFMQLPIVIEINDDDTPLCKAMLWRIRPAFYDQAYTHIICRDLDSPLTYRERQCVHQWIEHDKTAHAITDSISHTIPLMGGMIGFKPNYFKWRMGVHKWDELLAQTHINFKTKGDDQTFLNSVVYPKIAGQGDDSITQHYMLGMPNTFLSDYHNSVPDIALPLAEDLKESNSTCGHIGAAGYYQGPTFKFLSKYKEIFADFRKAEFLHRHIFFWGNEI